MLVAHVRKKTVGPTRIENTHPFARSGWIFAHNGTLTDLEYVRSAASPARRAEIQGDTDSELLFALFLTRLDAAGLRRDDAHERIHGVLADTAQELRERNVGAFSTLMSNGETCFAHRFGRTLFTLERHAGGRRTVVIASARLTDDAWSEIPEGTFFRVDRRPVPSLVWRDSATRAA